MKVVRRAPPPAAQKPTREPNYTDLDKPAVARKRAVGDGVTGSDSLEDLLDIPAFLRRQADLRCAGRGPACSLLRDLRLW